MRSVYSVQRHESSHTLLGCLLQCAGSGSCRAACIVRSSQKPRPLKHSLRTWQVPVNDHAADVVSLDSSSDRFGVCDRIASRSNGSLYLDYPRLQRSRLARVQPAQLRRLLAQSLSTCSPDILYQQALLWRHCIQCHRDDRRFYNYSNHSHNWRQPDRYRSRDRYAVRLDPGASSCKRRSL